MDPEKKVLSDRRARQSRQSSQANRTNQPLHNNQEYIVVVNEEPMDGYKNALVTCLCGVFWLGCCMIGLNGG